MADANVLPFIKVGGGGGFLNGVSGVIESIVWGKPKTGEGKDGEEYRLLSAELMVRPDGADEAVQQFLSAGFLRGDNSVSKDGSTIEGEDDFTIQANTDLAKFLTSLIAAGFDAALLGDGRDLSALAGNRYTFERKQDEEKTKRMGMRKDKKNKDPKTGKAREYMQDVLLVSAHLGAVEAAPKGKGKATAAKSTKPAAGAKKVAAAEDNSQAVDAIKGILAKNKGRIELSKIGPAFVKYSLATDMSEADRKSVRAQIADADFLATLEGDNIVFDAESGIIASAE
jgi:hypothetical protein